MCLAVPGEIVRITDNDPLVRKAEVSFGGFVREVSLILQPDAAVGDYVIVHAGFAISTLDEDAARRTIAEFESLSDFTDEDSKRL